MGVVPMNRFTRGLAVSTSRPSRQNIHNPAATNPRFPSVLTGSRRRPPLTRSHQREISPMACSLPAGGPQPITPTAVKTVPKTTTAQAAYRRGV